MDKTYLSYGTWFGTTQTESLDVSTMSKRVDALCGSRSDTDVATWLGVTVDAVGALRQGRDLDIDDGDTIRMLDKLATVTGVSVAWILGHQDEVLPRRATSWCPYWQRVNPAKPGPGTN